LVNNYSFNPADSYSSH